MKVKINDNNISFLVRQLLTFDNIINLKSDYLQYNTVEYAWNNGMIVQPSDGPMFILID